MLVEANEKLFIIGKDFEDQFKNIMDTKVSILAKFKGEYFVTVQIKESLVHGT